MTLSAWAYITILNKPNEIITLGNCSHETNIEAVLL